MKVSARRLCAPAALAILAALFAGGCAGPAAPAGPLPTVVAKHERRLADGRLIVAATLKNSGGGPARAEVGCQFLDAAGQPVGAPAAWQAVELAPGEAGTVQFAAEGLSAAGETLAVRPASAGR